MKKALTKTLETIKGDTSGEKVTVHDIVEALNSRGFGPMLIGPALICILPTGAIPGMPTVCALLIIFASVQLLMGQKHPWIPDRLGKLEFDRDKFLEAIDKAKPYVEKIDKYTHRRFKFLVENGGKIFSAILSVFLSIAIMILGFIPFMAALPASGVLFLGLGLSNRDGLMIMIAIVIAVITLGSFPYAYSVLFD